jgi:hypothetical protein|tara:strand:- start:2184 stop:2405 length:222 start_codon:yes stop_codon:yes gene_type:complete
MNKNVKNILKATLLLLVAVPLAVIGATFLWNAVLVEAVTWANYINPWQMLGIMVLYYIMFPGQKSTLKSKNNG